MWLLISPHLFILIMTVLSTAYFPPIIWMAYIHQKKNISIDVKETYPKQTYRNRCQIATATGIINLSIPVKKPNGNQTISEDIGFEDRQKWQSQHWKSIKTAYDSSPFFLYYQDEIEELLKKEYSSLIELNEAIIKELTSLMNLDIEINYTDDFAPIENGKIDLRFDIHPKKKLPVKYPKYYQTFDDKLGFIPNLSILDLLFNLGPESILYLESINLDKIDN